MSKIEMGKTYLTRGGSEVRIYAVDGSEPYPVHGAIATAEGMVSVCWTARGTPFLDNCERDSDLIEVKPRIQRTVWVNVYPTVGISIWDTRKLADSFATPARIACIPITIDCAEGEGLE